MLKFKPLANFLLVCPQSDNEEEKSAGGIFLPSLGQTKYATGVVWCKGPEVSSLVDIGDTIVYDKFAGVEMRANKTLYLILRSTEIYCVVSKEVEN